VFEFNEFQHGVNSPFRFCSWDFENPGVKTQQLFGGEKFVVIREFRRYPIALPRNRLTNVRAEDPGCAAGSVHEAEQTFMVVVLPAPLGRENQTLRLPDRKGEAFHGHSIRLAGASPAVNHAKT